MRIITGKFKNRALRMPKGAKIRPTSEMVKKAIFDILGPVVVDSSFLELFAGSGNVGIEALSRGAREVVFVDNDRRCMRSVEENLKSLNMAYIYGLDEKAASNKTAIKLLPFDAQRALEVLSDRGCKFDIAFLDPPYGEDNLKNCLIKISRCDILNARCLVVAEHSTRDVIPQRFSNLTLLSSKEYGDSTLSFYQKEIQR
ncbi:MAG: 16S rRNA (guanine(966)-N(2))-methyltransferase RsmD [Candidatus Omnitrophica bacterium]|nr:16S rRNA (guanine(966)-N(2))-methyltransferase RsmD [Candidatus Omnitrophota bacterium]